MHTFADSYLITRIHAQLVCAPFVHAGERLPSRSKTGMFVLPGHACIRPITHAPPVIRQAVFLGGWWVAVMASCETRARGLFQLGDILPTGECWG